MDRERYRRILGEVSTSFQSFREDIARRMKDQSIDDQAATIAIIVAHLRRHAEYLQDTYRDAPPDLWPELLLLENITYDNIVMLGVKEIKVGR